MECPKCQFDNTNEAKFCGKCGEKLSLVCPRCGSENTLDYNFCNKCGQKLKEVEKTEEKALKVEG